MYQPKRSRSQREECTGSQCDEAIASEVHNGMIGHPLKLNECHPSGKPILLADVQVWALADMRQERRNMIAHPLAFGSGIALIPFPYVTIVSPMTQLLPRDLLRSIERQWIRHSDVEFGFTDIAAISDPLQSLKKEGARDRHFRTLIYLHVVRNWAWLSRSRSHRELLLRPVGGQLFWFRRPPHRSYRVDRPASPAAAARSGGPGASQPQMPRKNPRLARELFRWLTALAHRWRLEQDEAFDICSLCCSSGSAFSIGTQRRIQSRKPHAFRRTTASTTALRDLWIQQRPRPPEHGRCSRRAQHLRKNPR